MLRVALTFLGIWLVSTIVASTILLLVGFPLSGLSGMVLAAIWTHIVIVIRRDSDATKH